MTPQTLITHPTMENFVAATGQTAVKAAVIQPFPKTKYVIFEVAGLEVPITFPSHMPHDTFVPRDKDGNDIYKVISAGFVQREGENVIAFGASTTLFVSARPEDAEIIGRAL